MFGKGLGGRAVFAVGYTGLGVAASRFGAQVALDRHFAGVHRQPVDRPVESRLLGHVAEQIVDRVGPDHFEHGRAIGVAQR